MNAHEEISRHRVPCGPMTVSVSAVCRRRLKDSFDTLLDRLTEEIHPELVPAETPKNHTRTEDGKILHNDAIARKKQAGDAMKKGEEKVKKEREKNAPHSEEVLQAKREKMIQEGRMKAEVKTGLKQYEEKLQGNSKMLQDISGKIEPR